MIISPFVESVMLEEDDTSFSLFAPWHFSPEAACTAETEET
jgi:hypothetical protein